MKKTFLLLLVMSFCIIGNSQNTFPSTGNVGIESINPEAKLDITLFGNTSNTVSGLRITTPSVFSSNSFVNTAFQIRSKNFFNGAFNSLFVVRPNGNVGIGVESSDPLLGNSRLVVSDGNINKVDLNVRGFALVDGLNASLLFGATGGEQFGQWGIEYNEFASVKGLNFWKPDGSNNFGNYFMFLADNGKVSIGLDPNHPNTYDGDYKLYVGEGIMTEKVKVAVHATSDWADYVFKKDYQLMPLSKVEEFITKEGHLPNIPSAQKVVEQGIDIAKMDAKLLEKIEELTLYMIEQNKRIQELETQLKMK